MPACLIYSLLHCIYKEFGRLGVTVWAWRHLALIRRLAHLSANVLFLTDNLKEINDTDDLTKCHSSGGEKGSYADEDCQKSRLNNTLSMQMHSPHARTGLYDAGGNNASPRKAYKNKSQIKQSRRLICQRALTQSPSPISIFT